MVGTVCSNTRRTTFSYLRACYVFREAHDEAVFWLFRVSYLWYSGLGCFATLVVGLAISFATGATHPADVPIDLISPPVVKFLNSLPITIKVSVSVNSKMLQGGGGIQCCRKKWVQWIVEVHYCTCQQASDFLVITLLICLFHCVIMLH